MAYDRADWSQHYDDDRSFRPLHDSERDLLTRRAPAPDGGRALELGCGTGELAVFLTELGYTVDAADFAEGETASSPHLDRRDNSPPPALQRHGWRIRPAESYLAARSAARWAGPGARTCLQEHEPVGTLRVRMTVVLPEGQGSGALPLRQGNRSS